MSDIIIPNFGESISEATISKWHAATDSQVNKGDPLVTLETDKVASDIEAEENGTLHILIPEGKDAPVGTVIGTISSSKTAPPVPPPSSTDQAPAPQQQEQKTTSNTVRYTRSPMSKLRQTIAAKLVEVQHAAALLTTFNECDMGAVIKLRNQYKEHHPNSKLGYMSFFIKAVVHALQSVPEINARIDGSDIITNHYYDISIAVGTDRGLIVPVLRDCDAKTHFELEAELAELSQKAKDNQLTPADMQGGVITITNGGIYGSLLSTPIPNHPQSAILGMHAIHEKPVVQNGQIVIRPIMNLALTYDHRLIDGKQAVTFLVEIKKMIESPILGL